MTGTERKVFQKYYPPDFDPKKLKKERGRKRGNQFVQRVMAPFNMQCNTCREYIYKGKKFNMRRETAEGESYLGLRIFRFYFRCPNCLAEISFKTDIENVDYTAEHGATRLFEAFKVYQEQEKEKELKEEAEKNDAMKMLEKRTKMSKAEMEATGKLEELQELSRRNLHTDPLKYLAELESRKQLSRDELLKLQAEEDEREIAMLMGLKKPKLDEKEEDGSSCESMSDDGLPYDPPGTSSTSSASNPVVPNSEPEAPTSSKSLYSSIRKQAASKPNSFLSGLVTKKPQSTGKLSVPIPSLSLAGLADYGSSSSEE